LPFFTTWNNNNIAPAIATCLENPDLIQFRSMAKYFTYNDQEISVGDTIRVHFKISEDEGKIQTQAFEGLVIGIDNRESNKSVTVRKIASDNIGVERIFPLQSPYVISLELKRKGDVRRAKLNYLRGRVGRGATKVKESFENAATQVPDVAPKTVSTKGAPRTQAAKAAAKAVPKTAVKTAPKAK